MITGVELVELIVLVQSKSNQSEAEQRESYDKQSVLLGVMTENLWVWETVIDSFQHFLAVF